MLGSLKAARNRAVPLVAVRTADQPAAASAIGEAFETPVVLCDPITGMSGINKAGEMAAIAMLDGMDPSMAGDPVTALGLAADAPEDTVVVLMAGDRALQEPQPAVAALLLRDRYAQTGRTLVALGASWSPAAELGSDVYVIVDELPTDEQRRESISTLLGDADLDADDDTLAAAVSYTRGLSRFAVEQTVSLSLSKAGVDVDQLSNVWREAIDRTPGLRVVSTGKTASMDDIAGLDAQKAHADRLTGGKARPQLVVWVDEIEKAVAGSSGSVADSSGASQAVLGALLSAMEDTKAEGELLVGPPGTGKSLAAQTIGAAAGVPTVALSLGSLKGSLVGQTEEQAARAMQVIAAMGGKVYWVATSNGLSSVPPELLRRFTDGVWMVDLPQDSELQALWRMYFDKYELSGDLPTAAASEGYAGADVRNVCRTAWRDEVPVSEIMESYVPASFANRDGIEALRRQAAGAYRSASYKGAYRLPTNDSAPKKGRKMNLK